MLTYGDIGFLATPWTEGAQLGHDVSSARISVQWGISFTFPGRLQQYCIKPLITLYFGAIKFLLVLGTRKNSQTFCLDFFSPPCFLPAACLPGSFGKECASRCDCSPGTPCNHVTGQCGCPPGFMGHGCEQCTEEGTALLRLLAESRELDGSIHYY